jgi:hypothetical protein
MPFATPFFAAFGPLLFGRAPRAAHELYQRHLPKADSILALREAFGSMIPDTLLGPQPKGSASRQRLL